MSQFVLYLAALVLLLFLGKWIVEAMRWIFDRRPLALRHKLSFPNLSLTQWLLLAACLLLAANLAVSLRPQPGRFRMLYDDADFMFIRLDTATGQLCTALPVEGHRRMLEKAKSLPKSDPNFPFEAAFPPCGK